jgi:Putative auto-transporter adhesin, head GIN domain
MRNSILLFIMVAWISYSCNLATIQGNGQIAKEMRTTTNFDAVEASGSVEVVLTQGRVETVEVETDQNLLEYITTEVSGRKLIIKQKASLSPSKRLIVYVTVVNLKEIKTSGAITITGTNQFHFPSLVIDASGVVDGKIDLFVDELKLEVSGSAELIITGRAKKANYDLSGATKLMALDFITEDCSLDVSGSSEAQVNANNTLDIDVSGASVVKYKGAAKVKQDVSGASSVEHI